MIQILYKVLILIVMLVQGVACACDEVNEHRAEASKRYLRLYEEVKELYLQNGIRVRPTIELSNPDNRFKWRRGKGTTESVGIAFLDCECIFINEAYFEEINASDEAIKIALIHEIAHMMGYEKHSEDKAHLMFPSWDYKATRRGYLQTREFKAKFDILVKDLKKLQAAESLTPPFTVMIPRAY